MIVQNEASSPVARTGKAVTQRVELDHGTEGLVARHPAFFSLQARIRNILGARVPSTEKA